MMKDLKMETIDYQKEYQLKNMEINALLELSNAINDNIKESQLVLAYQFTLMGSAGVGRLALFIVEETNARTMNCKAQFNTAQNYTQAPLPEAFLDITKITKKEDFGPNVDESFQEFDVLIPVSHKDQRLAMLFVAQKEVGRVNDMNLQFIQAITNLVAVAIENKKFARQQMKQELMSRELEIAHQVQKSLLPTKLPQGDKFHVAAEYVPHHGIGGDYYDYISLDDHRFLICMADVSGKGVPAALVMSNFQASLRTIILHTTDLKEAVAAVNHQIYSRNGQDKFITVFLAIYDQREQQLNYVNAGHNQPMLIREDGRLELLDQGSTVIGIMDPLPFISEGVVKNLTEFTLFCYTDGLTETFNTAEDDFGEERTEECLRRNFRKKPDEINQIMMDALNDFRGEVPFADDISLLTIKKWD